MCLAMRMLGPLRWGQLPIIAIVRNQNSHGHGVRRQKGMPIATLTAVPMIVPMIAPMHGRTCMTLTCTGLT